MLDLKDNELLLKMKEQLVQEEVKVEVKDIENKIKQIKIEVNTNLHNNIDKGVVMNKINYKGATDNKQNYIDLKDIKRGDVIWINLFGSVGSEQSSDENGRPCVCIQNDVGNAHSPTIIVSAITSQIKTRLPIHVEIPSSENYGLTKDSVVLLEQIRTVDKKKRILRKTGHLDDLVMKKINKALAISVGVLQEKKSIERLPVEMQKYIITSFKMIDTYTTTIETMKENDVSASAIDLIEDRKFSEENGLRCYCDKNRINYDIIYNDYQEIMREKEEDIAL